MYGKISINFSVCTFAFSFLPLVSLRFYATKCFFPFFISFRVPCKYLIEGREKKLSFDARNRGWRNRKKRKKFNEIKNQRLVLLASDVHQPIDSPVVRVIDRRKHFRAGLMRE